MLREEVLREWRNYKKISFSLQKEVKELRPLASITKNATWEVYATKVLLLREEISGSRLNDILSSWEGSASHYTGKSPGIQKHHRYLIGKQLVASWKVFPVKVLTIRREHLETLEDRLMSESYSRHLVKLLGEAPHSLPDPADSKVKKITNG